MLEYPVQAHLTHQGTFENRGQSCKEVWRNTRQLRKLGACISPWNKHLQKPLRPKETIKTLMIPQETLALPLAVRLYTSNFSRADFQINQRWKVQGNVPAQLLLFLVWKWEVGAGKWPAEDIVSQTQVSSLSIKNNFFHHTVQPKYVHRGSAGHSLKFLEAPMLYKSMTMGSWAQGV